MPGSEFEIKVSGLPELKKSLFAYSNKLGQKVVVDSLKQGARLVQRGAKTRAPRGATGNLRRSITIKKSKLYSVRRGRGKIGVYLTIKPKGYYGGFIEHGTKNIVPRRFISRAFNSHAVQAIRLIIASAERGASIVAKRMGF